MILNDHPIKTIASFGDSRVIDRRNTARVKEIAAVIKFQPFRIGILQNLARDARALALSFALCPKVQLSERML